ncbi:MAG: insulinase family protein [Acidobacteria bacterium]|nr:insulinase family protein [Acidobacteriota bacterium]
MKPIRAWTGALLALALAGLAGAQDLAQYEKQVTQHTLKNGMKILILERHDVPVVSFHNYADVGSANETVGTTGIAHLFEHMAFKGTTTIGTKNYQAEKVALEKLDKAYERLADERRKGTRADPEKLRALEEEFKKAQEEADKYVVNNELGTIIEENGGVGLNASTGSDATRYYFNFPSNRLELWFSLESERFLRPVLREFYKERDVVMEERRLRTESQPIGRLIEEFLAVAYKAHPYGQPTIGHRSDLEAITRAQAASFFTKHYAPQNLTVAVVGDVDPKEVIRLAELYFGRIQPGPKPEPVSTMEPPQEGEKRFDVEAQSQPILLMGFHKPDILHKDDAVFDVVTGVLSGGRSSRLYKSLVKEKKIAAAAGGFPDFPGVKYPGLFLFFSVPVPGQSNDANEKAIEEEIERLKKEPVSEAELKKVKNQARARLIRQLQSNSGMASQLAFYQAVTGDWRNLFRQLEDIDKVTADDVQRVVQEYFTRKNRTVGYLIPERTEQGGGE